ncbi:MAG: TRAP transporter small permease [Opitutales bacterium]
MKALSGLNRGLVSLLQGILVLVFLLLVVDVVWGVVTRYLLGSQAAWSEELARFLMVWLALLGAALACREQSHLGLDALVRTWPEDVRKYGNILVHSLVLVFAVSIMGYGGGQLVVERFASGQTLPALGIARGWFYLALPVSGWLIALFSFELLILTIWGPEKSDGGDA